MRGESEDCSIVQQASRLDARGQVRNRHSLLLRAGVKVLQRPVHRRLNDECEAGADARGLLEEFADGARAFIGVPRVQAGLTQTRRDADLRRFTLVLPCRNDENIRPQAEHIAERIVGWHQPLVLKHTRQNHISHRKTDRGRGRASEEFNKIVVPPAPGNGALRAADFMRLENHAAVVREAAHDERIKLEPSFDGEGLTRLHDGGEEHIHIRNQRTAPAFSIHEAPIQQTIQSFLPAKPQRLRSRNRFRFVDLGKRIEQRKNISESLRRNALQSETIFDERATAESDLNIIGRETNGAQRFDTTSENFHILLNPSLLVILRAAQQIHIPLQKLPKAAALRALGAEVGSDAEPLRRLGQAPGPGRDHSRECWRELRAQRVPGALVGAPWWRSSLNWALVVSVRGMNSSESCATMERSLAGRPALEGKQLRQNPLAALDRIEIGVLEPRAVDLHEPVANRGPAPLLLDPAPAQHLGGIEIPRAARRLKNVLPSRSGRGLAHAHRVDIALRRRASGATGAGSSTNRIDIMRKSSTPIVLFIAVAAGLGAAIWTLATTTPAKPPVVDPMTSATDQVINIPTRIDNWTTVSQAILARTTETPSDVEILVNEWLNSLQPEWATASGAEAMIWYSLSHQLAQQGGRYGPDYSRPEAVAARARAIDLLLEFSQRHPARMTYWHWNSLAWAWVRSGQLRSAAGALERTETAINELPDDYPSDDLFAAIVRLASCLGPNGLGDDEGQRAFLSRVGSIIERRAQSSDNRLTWMWLVRMQSSINDSDGAAVSIARAQAQLLAAPTAADNRQSWSNLAQVAGSLGLDDVAREALDHFARELDEHGEEARQNLTWNALGWGYADLGDEDRALSSWRRWLDAQLDRAGKKPADSGSLYNLACAWALTRQPDRALDTLEKAVEAGWLDAGKILSDRDLASLQKLDRLDTIISTIHQRRMEKFPADAPLGVSPVPFP